MTSSRTEDFVRRLAEPDPTVAALVEHPDDITTRILRAAIEQAELVGMRRSTMEDVARRSGVGRATLYRRFPTKAALNDAIVLSEARRFLDGSARARAQGKTFEDRVVYSTVFTVAFMREHALLKKLLRTEPETLLPSLTVDAGAIIDFATEYSAALLRSELYGTAPITPAQERHLRTVAELNTRLTLSFIVTPHTGIKLTTIEETRAYVRDYLLPMATAAIDSPGA
ncbi:TetR/AcrR family transcriptional regulator [Mycobacterium sp. CBMA293]|uniref:TetR/AcrR family transcriptional regulator n=1 Tax=unclassified Mycolicibacterium TaxID=2636767 RepID=UPI0012DC506C|nr:MULTISPECIES: TetR/AcrR family transcriptional regulator [unclassified Mycolicibacterium]MUL47489.1 TetR/AcrR family transcriptional regulator [Mycolicibacterium sp. CBMA 360]MUL59475.1 TetR/AcrR family transcriptional regulator [Mycolicibacterium sp. CBMA 335]MUL67384.1 TetR family transcriptional regulator [Mycolicibacterium sp. CBMA 234]MUL71200.1 TetR/AcrR family transcriptional regulator [Mycolicibacterium sp. CBMA 311]MUL94843.1 TetR/AcrR family transcriptional regulator [Mycolicibact